MVSLITPFYSNFSEELPQSRMAFPLLGSFLIHIIHTSIFME